MMTLDRGVEKFLSNMLLSHQKRKRIWSKQKEEGKLLIKEFHYFLGAKNVPYLVPEVIDFYLDKKNHKEQSLDP